MKHLIPLASLSLLALPAADDPVAPKAPQRFVVHEWGTFTSVQGSDAVTLDGIHHEEEALPPFVHARTREGGWPEYQKKMETPVTYFHAPAAMKVRVSVEFPGGVFTQWFPEVVATRPPLPADRTPRDDRPGEDPEAPPAGPGIAPQGGFLDWGELEVLPPGARAEEVQLFPADLDAFTWGHARRTGANLVRGSNGELEKFLFYRGLGKFLAPLRVSASGADRVKLVASGAHGARRLLLLHVDGARAGFRLVGDLAAGREAEVAFPAADRPLEDFVRDVGRVLVTELTAEGLYEDEAVAMVSTWSRQYFRTPGRRILYVLEQSFTDAVIPLRISPAPAETRRVMVARVECVSPAREAELVAWAEDLVAEEAETRQAARKKFADLGRFAESSLRRVQAIVRERAAVRGAVEALLAELSVVR